MRRMAGDKQIKDFEAALTSILSPDDLPLEALGDLSDLLNTLRQGVNRLTAIMEMRKSFQRDPATKLYELEILLTDDLQMIIRDLAPSLRIMRKAAPSLQKE